MEGTHYLDYLNNFVNKLRATNSRLEKEEILEKWWKEQRDFCLRFKVENHLLKLFHHVYDYDKQYYITSTNVLKKDLSEKGLFVGKNYDNLWSLLDDLSNRLITGHNAIIAVQQFLKQHDEDQQKLILNIIDKDLKCGLSEVTINKVCGNIIKTYDVALADKFNPKKHILTSDWVIERKLDGVRCNVINKNGIIKCYSRQGKEITTLSKLVNELQGRLPDNTVLDGEVCLVDENGLESFQGIMKEIKRKNHTIENPLLLAFDMLTLEEFENKKGNTIYTVRMERLKEWYSLQDWDGVAKHLSIVNYEVYSPDTLEQWTKRVKDYNWEGLMFRKDTGYEGKRSQNLLKFKMWQSEEFFVTSVENGLITVVEDGVAKQKMLMSNITIKLSENEFCNVGSGFSKEDRELYYKNPDLILNHQVEIKYFEKTKNQNGSISLRFPIFKCIRDEII